MRAWLLGSVLACALLPAGLAVAGSKQIRVSYDFSGLNEMVCNPKGDCKLSAKAKEQKLELLLAELRPVVPMRLARVLLPAGHEFVRADLRPGKSQIIDYPHRLTGHYQALCSENVFDSGASSLTQGEYPEAWMGSPKIEHFRGYSIVNVPLYPVRFLASGKAITMKDAELIVTATSRKKTNAFYRASQQDLDDANVAVDNAEQIVETAKLNPPAAKGYLIIGERALVGAKEDSVLRPLIEEKEKRGINVSIAALEDVSPKKDPAEIRRFIADRYRAANMFYVLLVGDNAHLPWKVLAAKLNGSDEMAEVPSDQYYACLDGEFDAINRYDWACEVAVGRVGVSSKDQLSAWVAKTMKFREIARNKDRSIGVLSFGEKLDTDILGKWDMERVHGGSSNAPASSGFPSTLKITAFYETLKTAELDEPDTVEGLEDYISDHGDTDLFSGDTFIYLSNRQNYHVINHLGHANEDSALLVDRPEIGRLTFEPNFIYSEGCLANMVFADNWTITAMRMPDHGPAAMVANTRLGVGYKGNQEGPSGSYHRNFWAARFDKKIKTVGEMNHRSKELVVNAHQGDNTFIYVGLETALMGDPELDVYPWLD